MHAPTRRIARGLAAAALGLAFALLGTEGVLRAGGWLELQSERVWGRWAGIWEREQSTWIHSYQPGERVRYETVEFTFEHVANGEGVVDRERELAAAPGCRRIVVLGDSFAEGVGAAGGESWPAALERELVGAGLHVEVLNAGMSGSDPCFEYQLLRQRFLRYRPDLVLVALNDSDVLDVIWWGGLERFRPEGTTRGRAAPPGFALFRHSHVARALFYGAFGMDRLSLSFDPPAQLSWAAQLSIVEACAAIDALRAEQPFEFLVLVHPAPGGRPLTAGVYYSSFHERLRERGIDSLDVSAELEREIAGMDADDLGWPIDGHFKAPGYAALGRVVARRLLAEPRLAALLAQPGD